MSGLASSWQPLSNRPARETEMSEESPSCVSCREPGEEATTTSAPPPLPVACLVDGPPSVVYLVDGVGDVQAAAVPYRSGRVWWFVVVLGWLFIFTALTQAIVAGVVRAQGIKVIDKFLGGGIVYPPAGNPWIGVLQLFTAVLFLAASRCRVIIHLSVSFEFYAVIVCVVCFGWSFGERAVYDALKDFDQCIDNVGGNYTVIWGGDCYCKDDEVIGGATNANVNVSTSCDIVLDYVDAILVSYIFMAILMGFSVVTLCVHCNMSQRELSTPYRR